MITTLRRQAGQLLIFGFDGVSVDARFRKRLEQMQPGGVILFARNLETARQTWTLLRDSERTALAPLFRCVDLEGGTVDRLKHAVAPAPSAAQVFAGNNKKLFRRHGALLGEESRRLGFNTDFAPVLDLLTAASLPVLGTRAVSVDANEVTAYAGEFLRGLRSARVLGCGKHYPGLGAASLDSHNQMPRILKSWDRLWDADLTPYRRLHPLMPFIMVAHARYPEAASDSLPASLSPFWIADTLRKRIGYRGLIISDDLEMGGITASMNIQDAAVETLRAGADMFLVCHKEEHVDRALEAVIRTAECDRSFARRVAEAAARVLEYKKRAASFLRISPAPTAAHIEQLRAALHRFTESIARGGR